MVSLLRPFRRSLFLKVFTATSIVATALIYLLGSNLDTRIERGIISEKESSSISEAKSVIQFATVKLTIGTLTSQQDLTSIAEEIVTQTRHTVSEPPARPPPLTATLPAACPKPSSGHQTPSHPPGDR